MALRRSPLAESTLVWDYLSVGQPDHLREQGHGVHDLLVWLLERRLRPTGEIVYTDRRWETYLVLQKPYVECVTFERLAEEMAISVQRIYELRTQAIATASTILRSALQDATQLGVWRERLVAERFRALSEASQNVLGLTSLTQESLTLKQITKVNDNHETTLHELILNRWVSKEGDFLIGTNAVVGDVVRVRATQAERVRWHTLLATSWEARPRWAIAHALEAGDGDGAAVLACTRFEQLVSQEESGVVSDLLGRFREGAVSPNNWCEVQLLAGDHALATEETRSAQSSYTTALAAAVRIGDQVNQITAHYRLGKTFQATNLDEALMHFERGLDLLDELDEGEHVEELMMLPIGLAWIYIQERPDLEKATAALARAERSNAEPSREWEAHFHNAHVGLADRQGDVAKKLKHGRNAWLAAVETQDVPLIFITGNNLGQSYIWQGEIEQGMYYLEEALARSREAAFQPGMAKCLQSIGAGYFFKKVFDKAVAYYMESYAIFVEIGNQNALGWVCHDLAEAHAELGDGKNFKLFCDEVNMISAELTSSLLANALTELKSTYPHFFITLTKREEDAIIYAKREGGITNKAYRELTDVSPRTAARDLDKLVDEGLLKKQGQGRATRYIAV